MKLIRLVAIASLFFSGNYAFGGKKLLLSDTTINHSLDGKINEWPAQKFEADAATQLKYAVDNDKQNLYLALRIPGFREQMRIMRQGMELYLDLKEKKKESKGIEFPVKREQSADNQVMNFRSQENNESGEQTPEQRKAMMKVMRAEMALNLNTIKVFGFSEDKSEEQGLAMPGSANVAFAWDSTDVMNIEYKIPLSFLGDLSAVEQKEINVGWKLNGFEISHNSSSESPGGGRHGGGGGHRGYGGGSYGNHGGDSNNQQNIENMMKDQSFWTKYIFK